MKRRSLIALAAGALAALGPARLPAQPAPLEIAVILPTTGPAAFLGSEEAAAYRVLAEVVNRNGGVRGRPVRFAIDDDASVPQNSVQLLAGATARKAPVVLGSAIAATCSAMAPVVDRGGGPLMYCLSPLLRPANGSFAFTAGAAPTDFEPMMLRYARSRGWNRIAILNSIDATGQAMEKELDTVLQSADARGQTVVAREHFSASDISVAAQVAQLKAQSPQVVLSFAAGASFGTLLRGLHDGGLAVPVIGAAGNMVRPQLDQYAAFMPPELFFFVSGGVAPNAFAPPAVRERERVYFAAFRAAGIQPGIPSGVAWDSGSIVVDALRALGPDVTATQLRDYVEALRGWAGVLGVYDFRTYPHRGLGPGATVVYRWEPALHDFAVLAQPK